MSLEASLTALLEETAWLRALARSLVADAHLADDLVQQVWLTALEKPPAQGRPFRGWLATVLRHRARDVARERARRAERERDAAEAEALPSSHDLVERAATQRVLVEAVLELDEPYRTTVLYRFFEGMPQRDIARRMRTTTATVNSRLTRALEKLRERLSRGRADHSWLQVLVPLLTDPNLGSAAALGVSTMKVFVSVLVVASVFLGIVLWRSPAEAERPIGGASLAAMEPASAPPRESNAVLAEPTGAGSERSIASVATVSHEASAVPEPAPAARVVRGRVLDASGVGIGGVALSVAAELSERAARAGCTSGAGGWFDIEVDGPAERIVAQDPRFETVLAGSARVAERTEPTVVVAPRIQVEGTVVDDHGAPLANAWVALRTPRNFGADWQMILDYSVPGHWRTRTDAAGRFTLDPAPAIGGATLNAVLGGFAAHEEPAPTRSESGRVIVLRRPHNTSSVVRGIVLDASGSPAEGAWVSSGAQSSHTDKNGEFTVDVSLRGTHERMVAAMRGHLPAALEPDTDASGVPLWPEFTVFQLGSPPGVVRGIVVDREDRPVAGAKVWLDDPTFFGEVAELHVATETLLRGSEAFWSFEVTGSDGAFEVGGLRFDRDYRLGAVDPRTLVGAKSERVRAGETRVKITLPTDATHERVAGSVRSKRGEPLAGIRVFLSRVTYEIDHGDGMDNEGESSAPTFTDAEGRFEFASVPKEGIVIIASGDKIFSEGAWIEEVSDPLRIDLVASMRLHLQVELEAPFDRADSVAILDAAGKQSFASVVRGGASLVDTYFPLKDGRSEVLAVREGAEVVALYRGGEEVARLPFQLSADSIQIVRY